VVVARVEVRAVVRVRAAVAREEVRVRAVVRTAMGEGQRAVAAAERAVAVHAAATMVDAGDYTLWVFLDHKVIAGWPRGLHVYDQPRSEVRQT
jgi:hypothetical protein